MILLPSLQLTVALEWWLRGHLRRIRDNCLGKCTDIPPGDGCKAHLVLLAPPAKIACSVVNLGTLFPSHFGPGWGSSGPDHEDTLDGTGIPLLLVLVAVYQFPDHQRYRMSRYLQIIPKQIPRERLRPVMMKTLLAASHISSSFKR